MIGSIRGLLLESDLDSCLIEATSGVGYKLSITSDVASELFRQKGQEVFLYVHTVVREDALDLYGFNTMAEKKLFQQVISVSGVGPRSGLAILSVAPSAQLRAAIAHGDTAFLTQVSGIGKKSAQKIILELQDKLVDEVVEGSYYQTDNDVIQALVSLGYSERDSRDALQKIEVDLDTANTAEKIKATLKLLA